jgi:hypothetical protein
VSEVGDQVCYILNADRDANDVLADAHSVAIGKSSTPSGATQPTNPGRDPTVHRSRAGQPRTQGEL